MVHHQISKLQTFLTELLPNLRVLSYTVQSINHIQSNLNLKMICKQKTYYFFNKNITNSVVMVVIDRRVTKIKNIKDRLA
jgi:hypothetical protein